MKIQDAIAEVVYRQVRANPKKFHPAVAMMADIVSDYERSYGTPERKHTESPSWKHFKENLGRYGCTGRTDARKD